MKTSFLFCLMLGVSAFSHPAELVDEFDVELEEQWTLFKYTHNRQYESKYEESVRKNIFERNLKMVQMHNLLHSRGLKSFTMALNKFSDMTSDEISSLRGVKIPRDYKRTGEKYVSPMNLGELPKELDWRTKGLVTRVKDQNPCGSCYAFSAVGAIEAQHARKTGQLVSLSEQDIVDCSFKYGNNGCNGGFPDYVFKYVIDNGIDTEASYQYIRDEQKCMHRNDTIGATIRALVDVESGNEQQLLEAVATVGPVSVGIDANHDSFIYYAGGVYEEPMCSHEDLDHGVLVVGYGTEDGKDYWLVKNSWGEDWGDKGYIKIKRNENYCGIALFPSYPVV